MKDETYITVLLDRSGSMNSVKQDTIGGFNQFISEQKAAGDNALLTLVQFDTGGIDIVHESRLIKEVPDLTNETYQPRGGTPLLDALGETIHSAGRALAAIPEQSRPDKVVFVIITDGQENASVEHSKASVKKLIEQQTKQYNWQFVYLGANQDAFAEADSIGIASAAAANYVGAATADAFDVASANVGSYRKTARAASLHFSGGQRARMMKLSVKPRLPK